MARTAEEVRVANREACARYREKNREQKRQKAREYAASHRDERRVYALTYYYKRVADGSYVKRKHSAKARERGRRYVAEHRDQYRAHCHKRRALKRGSEGSYTAAEVTAIIESQKNVCVYCKKPLGNDYHVDHIVPLSKGGDNTKYNIQVLCPGCNLSKSATHPVSFAQSKGMLL